MGKPVQSLGISVASPSVSALDLPLGTSCQRRADPARLVPGRVLTASEETPLSDQAASVPSPSARFPHHYQAPLNLPSILVFAYISLRFVFVFSDMTTGIFMVDTKTVSYLLFLLKACSSTLLLVCSCMLVYLLLMMGIQFDHLIPSLNFSPTEYCVRRSCFRRW